MPTAINWTFLDAKSESATFTIEVPDGLTQAQYTEFIEAVTPNLDAMTGGQITRVSITLGLTITGVPGAGAISTSDVEEKARFVFTSANGFKKTMSLPTALESIFTAGGEVNQTVTEVTNFITQMISGAGTLPVQPTDYRGDDIVSFVKGREYFAKNRKT